MPGSSAPLPCTPHHLASGRIGEYEQQPEYPLTPLEDESVPYEQLTYVEKMKLTPDRTALIVSKGLTLAGIPESCFHYRLGNRSALEWVIDQYQLSTDARSGISSNPNRVDDPQDISPIPMASSCMTRDFGFFQRISSDYASRYFRVYRL